MSSTHDQGYYVNISAEEEHEGLERVYMISEISGDSNGIAFSEVMKSDVFQDTVG